MLHPLAESLFVFPGVPHRHLVQHGPDRCLAQRSAHDQLVQHPVRPLEIKHNVQLTHKPVRLVQRLHVFLDEVERAQFVVIIADPNNEEQRRVSLINNLAVSVFQHIAHLGPTQWDQRTQLLHQHLFLLVSERNKPFGESNLALFG